MLNSRLSRGRDSCIHRRCTERFCSTRLCFSESYLPGLKGFSNWGGSEEGDRLRLKNMKISYEFEPRRISFAGRSEACQILTASNMTTVP